MASAMAAPPAEVAECPSCGARVPLDAKECPNCGELFAEELLETPAAAEGAKASGKAGAAEEEPEAKPSRMEKLMFWAGVILVLIGGPGIALGSWLHDVLHIAFVGQAFTVFGPLNRTFALVGLVVLLAGIVVLILSLRFVRPTLDYDVGNPKKA